MRARGGKGRENQGRQLRCAPVRRALGLSGKGGDTYVLGAGLFVACSVSSHGALGRQFPAGSRAQWWCVYCVGPMLPVTVPFWLNTLSFVSSGPYFLSLLGQERACLAPRPGPAPPRQQLCHSSWGQRLVVPASQGIACTLLLSPLTSLCLAEEGTLDSSGSLFQSLPPGPSSAAQGPLPYCVRRIHPGFPLSPVLLPWDLPTPCCSCCLLTPG